VIDKDSNYEINIEFSLKINYLIIYFEFQKIKNLKVTISNEKEVEDIHFYKLSNEITAQIN
jgi:hypothetical protein